MAELNFESQFGKIEKYYQGYVATHLIHIGDKLGLFSLLNENKSGLTVSEIASKLGKSFDKINDKLEEFYGDILIALDKKKIFENDIKDILINLVNGKSFEESIKKEKIDTKGIEEKIMKIIKSKPGLSANAYMGLVMKEFKGQINGKDAMEIIERFVK